MIIMSHTAAIDPTVTSMLKDQHKLIVASGEELREMVDILLMDAVIPLDHVATALEQVLLCCNSIIWTMKRLQFSTVAADINRR